MPFVSIFDCRVLQVVNVLLAQLVGTDRPEGELVGGWRIDLKDAVFLPEKLVFLHNESQSATRPMYPPPLLGMPTFSISIRASLFSVPLSSLVLEMASPSMALGTDVSAMISVRLYSVWIEVLGRFQSVVWYRRRV